jgi:hypothetical protein
VRRDCFGCSGVQLVTNELKQSQFYSREYFGYLEHSDIDNYSGINYSNNGQDRRRRMRRVY